MAPEIGAACAAKTLQKRTMREAVLMLNCILRDFGEAGSDLYWDKL